MCSASHPLLVLSNDYLIEKKNSNTNPTGPQDEDEKRRRIAPLLPIEDWFKKRTGSKLAPGSNIREHFQFFKLFSIKTRFCNQKFAPQIKILEKSKYLNEKKIGAPTFSYQISECWIRPRSKYSEQKNLIVQKRIEKAHHHW